MALEQELKYIQEDFEEAYYSRKRDLEIISNIDRKIMQMHWGGIVVECFTKYLIVEKYGMNRMRKQGEWFSDYTKDILKSKEDELKQSGKQLKSTDYIAYACRVGSRHNFIDWIKDILKFDTNQINDDLNRVYSPLNIEGKNFIDLRYEGDGNIDIDVIEMEYNNWKSSYNKVITWLNRYADSLTREDYNI